MNVGNVSVLIDKVTVFSLQGKKISCIVFPGTLISHKVPKQL